MTASGGRRGATSGVYADVLDPDSAPSDDPELGSAQGRHKGTSAAAHRFRGRSGESRMAQTIEGGTPSTLVAGVTKIGYDRFEEEIEAHGTGPASGPRHSDHRRCRRSCPVPASVRGRHRGGARGRTAGSTRSRCPSRSAKERGLESSGTFTGVTVDGERQASTGTQGTPLQLAGSGSLVPSSGDRSTSTRRASRSRSASAPRRGEGRLHDPAHRGRQVRRQQGGPRARQSVSFKAYATASGDLPPVRSAPSFATRTFNDGAGQVVLTGSLALVQPDGTQAPSTAVTLDSGPFDLKFLPAGGRPDDQSDPRGARSRPSSG